VIRTDQTFIPYEADSYARAYAWATEQLARKYPGSINLVEAQKSMIEQHLKAHEK